MTTGYDIECDGCDEIIEDMNDVWVGPDLTGEATHGMSVFHSEECAWRYHDRLHTEFVEGCGSCKLARRR